MIVLSPVRIFGQSPTAAQARIGGHEFMARLRAFRFDEREEREMKPFGGRLPVRATQDSCFGAMYRARESNLADKASPAKACREAGSAGGEGESMRASRLCQAACPLTFGARMRLPASTRRVVSTAFTGPACDVGSSRSVQNRPCSRPGSSYLMGWRPGVQSCPSICNRIPQFMSRGPVDSCWVASVVSVRLVASVQNGVRRNCVPS